MDENTRMSRETARGRPLEAAARGDGSPCFFSSCSNDERTFHSIPASTVGKIEATVAITFLFLQSRQYYVCKQPSRWPPRKSSVRPCRPVVVDPAARPAGTLRQTESACCHVRGRNQAGGWRPAGGVHEKRDHGVAVPVPGERTVYILTESQYIKQQPHRAWNLSFTEYVRYTIQINAKRPNRTSA